MSRTYKRGDRVFVQRLATLSEPEQGCPVDGKVYEATIAFDNPGLETVRFADLPLEWGLKGFAVVTPNQALPADPDPVKNPSHYKAPGLDVECMDIIQALGLDFCLGSALKYIWRHQSKGNPLQDLRKARENLDRAIKQLEAQEPPQSDSAPESNAPER